MEHVIPALGQHLRARLGPSAFAVNLLEAPGSRFVSLLNDGFPPGVVERSLRYTVDSPIPGPEAARTATARP